MKRKQNMKCIKVPKDNKRAAKQLFRNHQFSRRNRDSDLDAEEFKEMVIYQPAPSMEKSPDYNELTQKPCGCPITAPDVIEMGYFEGDDRIGITTKSYLIDDNSSLVSIKDPDTFFDGIRKIKACKTVGCPCANKLEPLSICNCRFDKICSNKKQNECQILNNTNDNDSVSLQVSESIVRPLFRQQKTQTSLIFDFDDSNEDYDNKEPRDCDPGDIGICPDYLTNVEEFETEDSQTLETISSCQDISLSPSPSQDYYLLWDTNATALDRICHPKPPEIRRCKLDMTPEEKLDMNECELLTYQKSLKTDLKPKKKQKKKLSVNDLLKNWCPTAFKDHVVIKPEKPTTPLSLSSQRNKIGNKTVSVSVRQFNLIDPLFNLKALTNPAHRPMACCIGWLPPADCQGLSLPCQRSSSNSDM